MCTMFLQAMWVKIQKRTAPSSRSQAAFTMRTLPSVKIANSIRYTQILIIDYQSSSTRKSTRNKDLSTFKNSSNNGWILLHWQVLQDLNKTWNYVSNMKYVADILFLHGVSSLTLSVNHKSCLLHNIWNSWRIQRSLAMFTILRLCLKDLWQPAWFKVKVKSHMTIFHVNHKLCLPHKPQECSRSVESIEWSP